MFFGTIDRYIGKTVLGLILICLIVLVMLTALITFIDQIRHLGDGDVDFVFLLWYVFLQLPNIIVMMFPISVLLGTVIGLGLLSKNSEVVIMLSVGMSKAKVILSASKMVIQVVLLVAIAGQTFVPKMLQYAESRYNYVSSEGRLSLTGWGSWIREGNSFVWISMVTSDGAIHNICRYDFDGVKLKKYSVANIGMYDNESKKWDIFGVTSYIYNEQQIEIKKEVAEKWSLYLTPERLDAFSLKKSQLNVFELYDYITYLEDNNIDSSRARINLYSKFIMPFAIVVMMILGASTIFGSSRTVPMSARVLLGLLLGFLFYLTNETLPNFCNLVGLPPCISVLLPCIIFTGVSFYLLNRKV